MRVLELTEGAGADAAFECAGVNAALEDLVDKGFDTLINHNDTAVKIIVHP